MMQIIFLKKDFLYDSCDYSIAWIDKNFIHLRRRP